MVPLFTQGILKVESKKRDKKDKYDIIGHKFYSFKICDLPVN